MEGLERVWDSEMRLSRSRRVVDDDEEALRWAALEKLPTYDRLRTSILTDIVENDNETSKLVYKEIDVRELGKKEKTEFIDKIFKIAEEDNEKFLRKFRDRIDRVGIQLPSVEVRFEHLTVEADCYTGNRALPTLINSFKDMAETILHLFGIQLAKKRKLTILNDISGILKPSRMALLLGPPSSGKSTLLLALAAKLDPELRVSGEVTYNGHRFDEFVPQRTSAYISQKDVHTPEMTVKETIDFSARCQGVGARYDLLGELARREKAAGIYPEAVLDLFMKATAIKGTKSSLHTDYILKILGIDICKDIIVGDHMIRGISGGQRKRVTTGEMMVGPTKTLFMDEISTGLDSSTTYQIVKCLQQIVHLTESTILMSLLQPAPETFDLFDDILLLSEGQIIYQGPRENILEFFENCGFHCPERKGVADFLQEVISRKDQEKYWVDNSQPYRYISPTEFVMEFKKSHVGQEQYRKLLTPYDKSKNHDASLVFAKYAISNMDLLKANFGKEWLLIKRNSFLYIFKTVQIIVMALISSTVYLRTNLHAQTEEDAYIYIGALTFTMVSHLFSSAAEMTIVLSRLPVIYKHRDLLFHPAWTFTLPNFLLRVPISIVESLVWMVVTYYSIGFAPEPSRFFKQFLLIILIQQMAVGFFRISSAICRTYTISQTGGTLILLIIYLFGGFAIPQDKVPDWLAWGHWGSPLFYAYKALVENELLAPRWMNIMDSQNRTSLGLSVLKTVGMSPEHCWFWIGAGALLGFTIAFNILFTFALMYLNPLGKPQAIIPEDVFDEEGVNHENRKEPRLRISRSTGGAPRSLSYKDDNNTRGINLSHRSSGSFIGNQTRNDNLALETTNGIGPKGGMVLPFTPLSMSFKNVNYYVNMPSEMKTLELEGERLQLLSQVSGAFRPGVLTALMGVSGAGKTTLMDVLAGRKTGGYIEGDIRISGFPKNQSTFARVSGYCEQSDIHSPQVTVGESLIYSAFLRLPSEVKDEDKMAFVNEVMELVELKTLKDALVGLPGITGLSTEQRKRLTIAVELVANPSIIFMDEPTSGLDARAAAIVMRTVRNTVDTGRTVVCTIHQPSIDIFEAFDELLLMKRGGQVVYMGPLGHNSHNVISYFEEIAGVPKIKEKYNPATWILEVSSNTNEIRLGIDFADYYKSSILYQRNDELIDELSTPAVGANDLYFPTHYSQSYWFQFKTCFWKHWLTYWRSPDYNFVRFLFTFVVAILVGVVYWGIGSKRDTATELRTVLGAMTTAVLFIGINNCGMVQPIIALERIVFYRERAAGMYSALSYAIAQVVIEIPYVFAQTTYYTLIVYAMMGFQWIATKFFWFFFISFFTFLYFTYYGMMTISITPNLQVGSILSASCYGIFHLFSGFYVQKPRIPKWWIWFYWICPVAWTVYGLIVSQYGDMEDVIQVPGLGDQKIKDYIAHTFGYDSDFMGQVAGVLIGFTIFFALLVCFGISVFNFQHR